jgi:uncharacterized lipoprotein
VRSAKAHRQISRLGVFAVCGLLLVGGLTGCSTTQEKAAQQQAWAKHILEAREKRSHKR